MILGRGPGPSQTIYQRVLIQVPFLMALGCSMQRVFLDIFGWCVCVCQPLFQRVLFFFGSHNFASRGPSPSPVADGQRRGHWGGLQTYLPNCCTSCHSTLSLFVSMVVHATSPKPFPSPLARVVVAPLQMRNLNVKTPSSLWTLHHAVPSPSFSTWELSVTENQCQSVFRSAVPLGC